MKPKTLVCDGCKRRKKRKFFPEHHYFFGKKPLCIACIDAPSGVHKEPAFGSNPQSRRVYARPLVPRIRDLIDGKEPVLV